MKETLPWSFRLATAEEVCKYLGISRWTLYRLLETGRLNGYKVGGNWRFRQRDIETYLETARVSPNRIFQNSVLLKYLDDPKKYKVTRKGKTGIIRLNPKYRSTLSKTKAGSGAFRYHKVRGSTGASFVSVAPREFSKLPREEQRHWLRLEIT